MLVKFLLLKKLQYLKCLFNFLFILLFRNLARCPLCGSDVDPQSFEYFANSYFQVLHNILRQHQQDIHFPSNAASRNSSPIMNPHPVHPSSDTGSPLIWSTAPRSESPRRSAIPLPDREPNCLNLPSPAFSDSPLLPLAYHHPRSSPHFSPPSPDKAPIASSSLFQGMDVDEHFSINTSTVSLQTRHLSSKCLQLMPYSRNTNFHQESDEALENRNADFSHSSDQKENKNKRQHYIYNTCNLLGSTFQNNISEHQASVDVNNPSDDSNKKEPFRSTNKLYDAVINQADTAVVVSSQIPPPSFSQNPFPLPLSPLSSSNVHMVSNAESNNPFTAPDSSVSRMEAANQIPEGLLVTGYYRRFFKEVKSLGSGAFGQVYLCHHVIDDLDLGTYAIKKVPVGNDRGWLHSSVKEVKIRERLNHPNLVEYKHCWLELHASNAMCPLVPWFFVLMEFCNAGDIENLLWISSDGSPREYLNDDQIWKLLADILFGLQHLHHAGILHRDLKPSNIMLQTDVDKVTGKLTSKALLADFGTAVRREELSIDSRRGFTGTAEFTAPELLRRDMRTGRLLHDFSAKADVWSVGVVLFAMCFNFLPYPEDVASGPDSARDKILRHKSLSNLIPPTPIRSPDLIALILAMTNEDPAVRPSVDDLLSHPRLQARLGDVDRMLAASESLARLIEENHPPECDIKEQFRRKMREKQNAMRKVNYDAGLQ